jgi:hypothetical protein
MTSEAMMRTTLHSEFSPLTALRARFRRFTAAATKLGFREKAGVRGNPLQASACAVLIP